MSGSDVVQELDMPFEDTGGGELNDAQAQAAATETPVSERSRQLEDQEEGPEGSDLDSVEDDGDDADADDDGDDPAAEGSDPWAVVDEDLPGEVKMVPSLFPDRAPTVFFEYMPELNMTRTDNEYDVERLGSRYLVYNCYWERLCVKNAFARAGFTRTRTLNTWSAIWGKGPPHEAYKTLNRFQKVNHIPGSWSIGRKDRLIRTLAKARRELPQASLRGEFDLCPEGFVLPVSRKAWLRAVAEDPNAIWILKPPASSCGKGIRLIHKNNLTLVARKKKNVIQRYIADPLLINGRKFDLRLYVLVTSVEPLRVYVFNEGLARLAVKKYSLRNLKSPITHLTNYSINSKSPDFKAAESSDPDNPDLEANKWSLTVFWRYMTEQLGAERTAEIQQTIEDMIVKTLIAADSETTSKVQQLCRHRNSCYELFGFDVMLDESLRPWLIEVNISPSLMGSSPLDIKVKGSLVADMFHLVGFQPQDAIALRREEAERQAAPPGTLRQGGRSGGAQDAWRRDPVPASIDLSKLDGEEWEYIKDLEDERNRRGNFKLLYPTEESIPRMWSLFQTPRYLNGVVARWLTTGGLKNARNRVLAGLKPPRQPGEQTPLPLRERRSLPPQLHLNDAPEPPSTRSATQRLSRASSRRGLVRSKPVWVDFDKTSDASMTGSGSPASSSRPTEVQALSPTSAVSTSCNSPVDRMPRKHSLGSSPQGGSDDKGVRMGVRKGSRRQSAAVSSCQESPSQQGSASARDSGLGWAPPYPPPIGSPPPPRAMGGATWDPTSTAKGPAMRVDLFPHSARAAIVSPILGWTPAGVPGPIPRVGSPALGRRRSSQQCPPGWTDVGGMGLMQRAIFPGGPGAISHCRVQP